MTTWEYSARTPQGRVERDAIERESREEVVAYLRRRRLIPIHIDPRPAELRLRPRSSVRTRDLAVFTRQLATLVEAGVPLVQSLAVLAEQAPSEALGDTVRDVVGDIESGRSLAAALREHPSVFGPLYVNMAEAGEAGGVLDTVLRRLASLLERQENLRRRVRGAMIYPAVVLVVAVAAVSVLLLAVIPTFEVMFEGLDRELPLLTRTVIALSDLLKANLPWVGTGTVLAGAGLWRWGRTDRGRLARDRTLLALPLLGDLARKAAISRFTRTLGTLLASGVGILDGLTITARTAGNRVVHDAVLVGRASVTRGRSVAAPLRETGVFPPMVTQMIHVGERTGELDGMLERIADFYEDEVEAAVEALVSAMEPAMIVILGVVVGGIIVALYLPIFSVVGAVG